MLQNLLTHLIFFGLICLYSCSPKSTGFFSNNYPSYKQLKTTPAINEEEKVFDCAEANSLSQCQEPISEAISSTGDGIKIKVKDQSKHNTTGIKKEKLSKEDKKQIRNEIKEILKEKNNNDTEVNTVLLVILAVLLPPLAVALVDGITGPFWLSILLTLLLYLPGLIYALYRIFRNE